MGIPIGKLNNLDKRVTAIEKNDIINPLTTKGDILGFNTAVARIPVGSNNQVLTADSTQSLGVKWATPISAVTPGGSNTQIQFNDLGAFGGDAAFTFNKFTGLIFINSGLYVGGIANLSVLQTDTMQGEDSVPYFSYNDAGQIMLGDVGGIYGPLVLQVDNNAVNISTLYNGSTHNILDDGIGGMEAYQTLRAGGGSNSAGILALFDGVNGDYNQIITSGDGQLTIPGILEIDGGVSMPTGALRDDQSSTGDSTTFLSSTGSTIRWRVASELNITTQAAQIDTTGLTANAGATTLYAVPSNAQGMYRISAYVTLTTAASVSSTLPNVQIVYTDPDSSATITMDATPVLGVAGIGQTGALTGNTVGLTSVGVIVVNAKLSTTIQYKTVNYASTAAGMAYSIHLRIEKMP